MTSSSPYSGFTPCLINASTHRLAVYPAVLMVIAWRVFHSEGSVTNLAGSNRPSSVAHGFKNETLRLIIKNIETSLYCTKNINNQTILLTSLILRSVTKNTSTRGSPHSHPLSDFVVAEPSKYQYKQLELYKNTCINITCTQVDYF